MFDIAINSGNMIDPANKISAKLNIGIKNGKISAISNENLRACKEINAKDRIVSPGFDQRMRHLSITSSWSG